MSSHTGLRVGVLFMDRARPVAPETMASQAMKRICARVG